MPARGKTRKSSRKDWLLDGETPRQLRAVAKDENTLGRETRQWLAVPAPEKQDDDAEAAGTAEAAPRQTRLRKPRAQPRGLGALFGAQRDRGLVEKLRRAQRLINAQREEIEELQDQVHALESELEKRRRAQASKRKAAVGSKAKRGSATRSTARRRPSLNTVTFEQLRKLGLTPTQSSRVIAYREAHEGFSSFDELSEIPGISEERASVLRDRLREPSSR